LKSFAKGQIASLIQKHGREVYAQVEERAASELGDRIKAQDQTGIENILRRYPHALIASDTKHQLARFKKEQGDAWQAIQTWREILEEPASASTRQRVLYELATTLEENRYLRPARTAWQQLRREFPSAQLPTQNGPQSATAFVTEHLQSAAYRRLDQSSPLLPLSRRWERGLDPESRVILPQGEPPGPLLDCVLIVDRGLTSVDFSQGQTLWQKPVNRPVVWAAYGPMHLILGTNESLFAVALETGQTLWHTALSDPDDDAESSPQFRLAGERIVILKRHDVSSIDITTGRLVWSKQATSRFSERWHADPEFVIVQNENPLRVGVIDAKTGDVLSEHRPSEPWISSPVPFRSPPVGSLKGTLPKNPGFIAAMRNQRIQAFGAYDPEADPSWIYRGAFSFANVPPWFYAANENLVTLMDGDTLIRLEPETGATTWFAKVSSRPLPSPDDGIVVEDARIYAAGSDSLKAIELKTGKLAWHEPLPEAPAWLLKKAGSVLMAVPFRSSDSRSQAILWDAKTGLRIQTLNVPPRVTQLIFRPNAALVIAHNKLLGVTSMPVVGSFEEKS
jgi:outer membrane protein assembly factor BamB